jgi:hypothetical protein
MVAKAEAVMESLSLLEREERGGKERRERGGKKAAQRFKLGLVAPTGLTQLSSLTSQQSL